MGRARAEEKQGKKEQSATRKPDVLHGWHFSSSDSKSVEPEKKEKGLRVQTQSTSRVCTFWLHLRGSSPGRPFPPTVQNMHTRQIAN